MWGPLFDRNSLLSGAVLGAVSGFVVAGIAATLMGLVAHLVIGSAGPRIRLSRCMLVIGVVAIDFGVGIGAKDQVGFAFGWLYCGVVFAVVHLLALGLTYSRRRPSRRSRLTGLAAWLGCGAVGLCLVLVPEEGLALAILPAAVLMLDVACLRTLAARRTAEIPISNRPTT